MNLKQNKGFGLADTIIAIVIFMIFTGVIVSISYNIYMESNFIKRNEQATNYIVEIFEYAQGLVHENIDNEQLVGYINNKYENARAISGVYTEGVASSSAYNIFINVEDIYPNYVKQIDITVMYKLGRKTKTVNMSTLINQ